MQALLHFFIEDFVIDSRFMLIQNFKSMNRCFCILAFPLYLLSKFLCILLYLISLFCKYDVLLVLSSLFLLMYCFIVLYYFRNSALDFSKPLQSTHVLCLYRILSLCIVAFVF